MTEPQPDAKWCRHCFDRDVDDPAKPFAGWGGHYTAEHHALALQPEERLALSVAVAQLDRLEDVKQNVAIVCIRALARIITQ